MAQVKLGALCWNQYTDWASLRDAGVRADALGYDSLWTWDHLYAIYGDPYQPIFGGYEVLAGWAVATERAKLGLDAEQAADEIVEMRGKVDDELRFVLVGERARQLDAVALFDDWGLGLVAEAKQGDAGSGLGELRDKAGQALDLVVVDLVGRHGDVGLGADLAGEGGKGDVVARAHQARGVGVQEQRQVGLVVEAGVLLQHQLVHGHDARGTEVGAVEQQVDLVETEGEDAGARQQVEIHLVQAGAVAQDHGLGVELH